MADTMTLQQRLSEAEDALHQLTIGRRTKAFTHAAGERSRTIAWTEADVEKLRAYVADLRRQLGQPSRRRAIGVNFR